MKQQHFTDRQVEILQSLKDRADKFKKDMLSEVLGNVLPLGSIEAVCQLINDEYLMHGINSDFSPNKYGLELEKLLDVVNRPRFIHKEMGRD